MSMWGGRFEGMTAAQFRAFNDSLRFDYRLAPYELQACNAWVDALSQQAVITAKEAEELTQGLANLASILDQQPAWPLESNAEDIHSWVEETLESMIGPVARKLHTGRSRNDLVATDLRLYALAQGQALGSALLDVIEQLLVFAERYEHQVIPGYTHLQRAQPILAAHWALAYVEMIERDFLRLQQALERASCSPLGSGALAGSGMPIDRVALGQALGFQAACRNSLDAVSDRDFVLELLHTASVSMMHLSRFSEDVIFYCSGESSIFQLSDAIASGSSLMPQKKNPDVFELIRGKTGRVAGHYQALLTTMKGLPMAYNKDLQEDKEGFFDAMTQWSDCLNILAFTLPHISINNELAMSAAQLGYSNATDLADYLVDRGMAFRDAHDISGRLVLLAIEARLPLEQLPLESMQAVCSDVQADVYAALSLTASLQRRDVLGGTSPKQVSEALRQARLRFRGERAGHTHVRQAQLADVSQIAELIRFWAAEGEHLPRRTEDIMQAIHTFAVAEANEQVVGCGALYVYGTGLAEIRSLGLEPNHTGQGLGAEIVEFLLEQARQLGIRRVIVLTRRPKFFVRLGFQITDKSQWPEKVMKDCEMCPRRDACDETALELWLERSTKILLKK
ncbi:MAG: argininosuccinate lyase [Idiomarina sp.]|nr:argininosuccinate lyase [Idiomarina sp.]